MKAIIEFLNSSEFNDRLNKVEEGTRKLNVRAEEITQNAAQTEMENMEKS